ncbi:MAG: Rieske (2Fe-2S) protein [Thermomicrobiales bacterium]
MAQSIQEKSTATPDANLVRVGPRAELKEVTVVSGGRHGIAVFATAEGIYAVDNRCPHMGFPLHRGSVCDGILTCHWHHARFDLESGGTFDPFADDVQTYETHLIDDVVYVDPRPRRDDRVTHAKARLRDGLEKQLSLVAVKNVLNLQEAGVPASEMLEIGGRFGTTYRARGWQAGLTIMTAMGNALPHLEPDDQTLALFHGLVHVAADCAGQPPRFALDPLPGQDIPKDRLKTWFRQFIEVRDSEGAERALLTAIAAGLSPVELADVMLVAATDHYFLDGGHTLDFINKACELLDLIGWEPEKASAILPSVVPVIAASRRAEELNNWRHPVDLVSLLDPVFAALPDLVQNAGKAPDWRWSTELTATMLGEDPEAIVAALTGALAAGAPLDALSLGLSSSAALRIARFHTANEFGDWITVLHTFTAANALHQSMRRMLSSGTARHLLASGEKSPSPELARGLFHGALRLYLDRFLNMPAARLPEDRPADISVLPDDPEVLLASLRDLFDREQQVQPAADTVYRYLALGHDPSPLIATLGHLLLREDGEFHSYQMLEAGIALFDEFAPVDPAVANRALIAVARYLAAHAPTSRSMLQTARIARRLQRGEDLFAEEDAAALAASLP